MRSPAAATQRSEGRPGLSLSISEETVRILLLAVGIGAACAPSAPAAPSPAPVAPAPADAGRGGVEGGTLFYGSEGSGEVVVLLHVGGQDHTAWAPQLPALAGSRVIRLD